MANAASPNSDIFSRTPFGSCIDYISLNTSKTARGVIGVEDPVRSHEVVAMPTGYRLAPALKKRCSPGC
jgi:hypothetical protein